MSQFANVLKRLRAAAEPHPEPQYRNGSRDHRTINVRDLRELLRDWERLDNAARTAYQQARGQCPKCFSAEHKGPCRESDLPSPEDRLHFHEHR